MLPTLWNYFPWNTELALNFAVWRTITFRVKIGVFSLNEFFEFDFDIGPRQLNDWIFSSLKYWMYLNCALIELRQIRNCEGVCIFYKKRSRSRFSKLHIIIGSQSDSLLSFFLTQQKRKGVLYDTRISSHELRDLCSGGFDFTCLVCVSSHKVSTYQTSYDRGSMSRTHSF